MRCTESLTSLVFISEHLKMCSWQFIWVFGMHACFLCMFHVHYLHLETSKLTRSSEYIDLCSLFTFKTFIAGKQIWVLTWVATLRWRSCSEGFQIIHLNQDQNDLQLKNFQAKQLKHKSRFAWKKNQMQIIHLIDLFCWEGFWTKIMHHNKR